MDTDVAVLGAGPAGLGAALRVARAGHAVTVLERGERVGGAAASLTVGGVRVDHGSHRLHPTTQPRVLAVLQELLGAELQRRHRNGRIRLADRWIAFPPRPGDLLRRLPRRFAAAAARDAAATSCRSLALAVGARATGERSPYGNTFADVLRGTLGPTMCEHFYFPYARKIWGVEPSDLAGEQARRRVSASSPAKLVRRVVSGAREPAWFWYPRRGFGSIPEALADAATDAGADLRLGAAVERVDLLADGVRVTVAGDDVVTARRAWSTLPLTVLARLVAPPPPPSVIAATTSLSYRAMLLVYLVLDVDRYTPFDAHYLPGEETPVTRISEPKNYRDGDDPEGRTVLCAEIPCDRGGGLWLADAGELVDVVSGALRACDLPEAAPVDVVVRRVPFAYPLYRAGYENAFERLDEWATGLERVLTFGRQGLFAHDNTHHALAMAWDAADALRPDGTFDAAAWAVAREGFRQHVVED